MTICPGVDDRRRPDAVPAPGELLVGPGRSWVAEECWRRVEIRVGGCWRPGRVERWRLRQGVTDWVALIRWGRGAADLGWYLYRQAAVRPSPGAGRVSGAAVRRWSGRG